MPRGLHLFLVISVWTLGVSSAFGDTIVFRDGSVIQGTFKWGSEERLALQVDGAIKEYPTDQVISITFQRTPATSTLPTSPPPTATVEAGRLTLPVGSRLLVRLSETLTTGSTGAGTRYAAVLEADASSDGTPVLKKGTRIFGRVVEETSAARVAGKPRLVLELTDVEVNGALVPVLTTILGFEGKDEAGSTISKVGAGAIIGAVIDGKKGAAKGAAVGGGVSLLTKGQEIQIPAGTVLEFRLRQPLTVGR